MPPPGLLPACLPVLHGVADWLCTGAYAHVAARSEGRLYLAWLTKRLAAAGGHLVAQRVGSLDELAGFDVVVNCSGAWPCAFFLDHLLNRSRGMPPCPCAPASQAAGTALCCATWWDVRLFWATGLWAAVELQGWAPRSCLATIACIQ